MKTIGRFFVKLFTGALFVADKVADAIKKAAVEALPIVQFIATLTPTRADDEIIRLFREYAVPGAEMWLSLPVDQRGPALLAVATAELRRRFPDMPVEQLQAAVQLALVSSRSKMSD